MTSAEPSQSTPCPNPSPLSVLISAWPSTNVAMPIGMFTKKTQCQLSVSVSTPPARSPSEPPATDTKTYAPIARERSAAPGNSVTMIARITDACAAAPMP